MMQVLGSAFSPGPSLRGPICSFLATSHAWLYNANMNAIQRVTIATAAISITAAACGDQYEHLKGSDAKFVGIYQFRNGASKESPKHRGYLDRSFYFSFTNNSFYEIAEVDIHLVMKQRKTNKVVYDCGVQTQKTFWSSHVPYVGSLLPQGQTAIANFVTYSMPSDAWRTDTYESFEVKEVRAYKDISDFHQMGHLYWLFRTSTPAKVISVLQKDPKLCTLANEVHLTTTHLAFATQGPEVINFVLAHGGSVKDTTTRGGKIIDYAGFSRDIRSLQMAVKIYGVNYQNGNGQTPIIRALISNNTPAIKWLLANGAKTEIEDISGGTPAMTAVEAGHPENLALMVKAGANPNHLNSHGFGWFHMALHNTSMLDTVLSYKVPVDQCDPKTKYTPLQFAADSGNMYAVEWFVAHGANPYIVNSKGHDGRYLSRHTNTLGTDQFFLEAVQRGLAQKKKLESKGKGKR